MSLPLGYVQVDYIKGQGNNFIGLPFFEDLSNYDGLSKWELVCQFTETISSSYMIVIGAYNGMDDNWYIYTNSTGKYAVYSSNDAESQTSTFSATDKVTIVGEVGVSSTEIYINGTLVYTMDCISQPLRLLGYYNFNYCGKAKIYSFKAYNDNDEVMLNLVPCQRILDNYNGLYDTCDGRFYGAWASGSSYPAILKGPNTYIPAKNILKQRIHLGDDSYSNFKLNNETLKVGYLDPYDDLSDNTKLNVFTVTSGDEFRLTIYNATGKTVYATISGEMDDSDGETTYFDNEDVELSQENELIYYTDSGSNISSGTVSIEFSGFRCVTYDYGRSF